jgi:hypothetical protein
MNYKTPQYAKSTKGNYLSKFKKEMETRKTHFFLYPIIIIMVVLKTIQDSENDITIAYRDADGNLHRRFIDTAITVKEALELARQEFPLVGKEGDRAVLKFQEYRVVGDNVPLLPEATYLLSILVPQVGKECSVEGIFPLLEPLNELLFRVEPPSTECLKEIISMDISTLEDIIGAIDKTTIGACPPSFLVDNYCNIHTGFLYELHRLRNEGLDFADDISSQCSFGDKFSMCVYPPRNLCGDSKLMTEIVALDMSLVERCVLADVFGSSVERLQEYLKIAEVNLNKLRSMFHVFVNQACSRVRFHVTKWFQRVYMLFLDEIINCLRSNCCLQVGWEVPLGVEICNDKDSDLISELSGDVDSDVSSELSEDEVPKSVGKVLTANGEAIEGLEAYGGKYLEAKAVQTINKVERAYNEKDKRTEIVTLHGYADIVVRDKSRLESNPLDSIKCLFQLKRPFGFLFHRAFPWQVDQLQCQLLGLRDASEDECVCCCLTDIFALVCGWQNLNAPDIPAVQYISQPLTKSREYALMLALLISDKADFSRLNSCVSTEESNSGTASVLGKRSVEGSLDGSPRHKRERRGDRVDQVQRKYCRTKYQYGLTSQIKAATGKWYDEIHAGSDSDDEYSPLTYNNLCLHDTEMALKTKTCDSQAVNDSM